MRIGIKLSDVKLALLGESDAPVATLIKCGALDLSKPGNLVKFLPKRPPAIVEADGDRIVRRPDERAGDREQRDAAAGAGDRDAGGERAGGGDGPRSPVRGAAGEPARAAAGVRGAARGPVAFAQSAPGAVGARRGQC